MAILWRNLEDRQRYREAVLGNCSTPPTPEKSGGKVRKKLPIGIENFQEFFSEDFYYVDKMLFIKKLFFYILRKSII